LSSLNLFKINVNGLTNLQKDNDNHLSDETLGNLMLTLSKLAVRNEFCQEICDKGGLNFVLKCIEEKHLKNISLLKSSLSLLKSICNNDQVKFAATKSNAIPLLRSVLDKYAANTNVNGRMINLRKIFNQTCIFFLRCAS